MQNRVFRLAYVGLFIILIVINWYLIWPIVFQLYQLYGARVFWVWLRLTLFALLFTVPFLILFESKRSWSIKSLIKKLAFVAFFEISTIPPAVFAMARLTFRNYIFY